MTWIQKNFKTFIYIAFLVPILTVAFVSISHVAKWYGLSNPVTWALYLSFGIEIAALSALAAISARMGSKVYFPFIIVTLIQFIGNIFFAYQYIQVDSQAFKDWVDLVDPLVSFLGVESGDAIGHKRFLALFAGGMLPIISLSFLHMLVKFEEEDRGKKDVVVSTDNIPEITTSNSDLEKYTPTQEELILLEETLRRINENKFKNLEPQIPEDLPTEKVSEEVVESIVEETIESNQLEPPVQEIIIEDQELIEVPKIEEVVVEEEVVIEEPAVDTNTIIEEVKEEEPINNIVIEEQPQVERKINRLSYTKRNANNVSVQRI